MQFKKNSVIYYNFRHTFVPYMELVWQVNTLIIFNLWSVDSGVTLIEILAIKKFNRLKFLTINRIVSR